jgi:hypothetical protein
VSDFFRIPAEPRLIAAGLTSLARLAHVAEDTSNDVLLMQVAAETESRGSRALDIFREEYIRLHRESRKDRRAALKAKGLLDLVLVAKEKCS